VKIGKGFKTRLRLRMRLFGFLKN